MHHHRPQWTRAFVIGALFSSLFVLAACDGGPPGPWTASAPIASGASPLPDAVAVPSDRLSGGCAYVGAGFLHMPPLVALVFALALAAAHRRRARVERAISPNAPLVNGPSVVSGVVEAEDGEPAPVVSVVLHQVGREQRRKGQWSHRWTEIQREANARPFFVRRADGARVRVEPEPTVVVHDGLTRTLRDGPITRVRIAEVVPGEEVHIAGTLFGAMGAAQASAYRDAPVVPVLRRPRLGPMVISAEEPGDTEAKRARFHGGWAIIMLILAGIAGLVLYDFDRLALTGQTVVVTPTAVCQWQVWVKPKNGNGYWQQHYGVQGHADIGPTTVVEDEVPSAAFACARDGTCKIPFRVSTFASGVVRVGSMPSLPGYDVVFAGPLGFLIILYTATTRLTRPWYMRRRVVDYGTGRLGETA